MLVTTGSIEEIYPENDGSTNNTEVINIFPYEVEVPIYQNYSKILDSATGGWFGNQLIVCGGHNTNTYDTFKECYKIGKENTSFVGNMKNARRYAASIMLEDGRLWILGGGDDNSNILKSTEYISAHDGSQEDGPDFPSPIWKHSAIIINETTSMIIGGSLLYYTEYEI